MPSNMLSNIAKNAERIIEEFARQDLGQCMLSDLMGDHMNNQELALKAFHALRNRGYTVTVQGSDAVVVWQETI